MSKLVFSTLRQGILRLQATLFQPRGDCERWFTMQDDFLGHPKPHPKGMVKKKHCFHPHFELNQGKHGDEIENHAVHDHAVMVIFVMVLV